MLIAIFPNSFYLPFYLDYVGCKAFNINFTMPTVVFRFISTMWDVKQHDEKYSDIREEWFYLDYVGCKVIDASSYQLRKKVLSRLCGM